MAGLIWQLTVYLFYTLAITVGVMGAAYAVAYLLAPCDHTNLRQVYGDEINACGGRREQCLDCGRYR